MRSRAEVERALIRAGGTPTDEQARRFYVGRVSDYARALALVFGGLYVVGIVLALIYQPDSIVQMHLHPGKLANLAIAVAAFAFSRITARANATTTVATIGETGLPVTAAALVALAAPTVPLHLSLYFAPLLIAAPLLMLRAALVPSPPSRTVVVGFATSVFVVVASYTFAAHDPHLKPPFTPEVLTLGSIAWCGALTGSTALASKVIYGLHRELQNVRRLGQYVLGELIGEGGMGAVYHAEHAMLQRPTAVKLLLPERVGPQSIQRFEREVQLTARLTHPNTVAVYDYGRTSDGVFYYAMEYLDGLSLEQLVKRYGPQPAGRVIHVLLQATGALTEAHGLGLIHRDVKPANILFCERGGAPDAVKLVDFGLVKELSQSSSPALTHSGALTGTPQYMAPESLLDPSSIDHRVDLYALGGVGYFLLTGRPPFEATTVLEICGHHLHTVPEAPSSRLGAPLPADLEALILRCLAKKPSDRPESAQDLHDALLECARTTPWTLAQGREFWREFRKSSLPPPAPLTPA